MIKSFIISFILVLITAQLYAADKFLLYHVNKQVHWLHDGKKEVAKRGVFLQPEQSIIITPKADVMVVQDNGKSLLLDKPGTFSFEQVKALLQKTKVESVSKNFFAYVFEKFLSGDEGNEKQRVAAVVYRGKKIMHSPLDSCFSFTTPVLQWKPQYTTVKHRIELNVNGVLFDTLVRNQTTFKIPDKLLSEDKYKATIIEWRCYEADTKQPPAAFIFIIPAKKDAVEIQSQLSYLKNVYGSRKTMLRIMEKDLFANWLETYRK
jgi:hypothetical protein